MNNELGLIKNKAVKWYIFLHSHVGDFYIWSNLKIFSVIVVITLQKVSFYISLLSVHRSLLLARVSLCMCDFQRKTSHSMTLQKSTSTSPIVKNEDETVWVPALNQNRLGFMCKKKRGMRSFHRVTFSQSVFLSCCLFFSFLLYFICLFLLYSEQRLYTHRNRSRPSEKWRRPLLNGRTRQPEANAVAKHVLTVR